MARVKGRYRVAAIVMAIVVCTCAPSRSKVAGSNRSANEATPSGPAPVELLTVRVLAKYPHDPTSFTQGLIWSAGGLYESVGQYGSSALLRVELETGRAQRRSELDAHLFGEGLAQVGERLIQLTWREGRALQYQAADFVRLGEFKYSGEGWGLAFDGHDLWMSDGSATLARRDATTFAEKGHLQVTLLGKPRDYLNELEWARGMLYANVWQSDTIVRIDPSTGQVTALIDAAGLLAAEERKPEDVLNGIAYDPDRDVFYLTGKLWPSLFEVKFVPADR